MGRAQIERSRKRQLVFFNKKSGYASCKQLGGTMMTSHPKRKRPISTQHENHIVMASSIARGDLSMRKGHPKTPQFWDGRPLTRIVIWGRDRLGLLK